MERIIERAEEFETKARGTEDELRATQEKVREMEHIVAENSDKEDSYENKVKVFRKISLISYQRFISSLAYGLCEDHRA